MMYSSGPSTHQTTTIVRSCTEFSHERLSPNSNSASTVSKLLIQPAHFKSQSTSRWTSPSSGRNPGVTLLHASDHVSIMPVRTIPAGRLKQLIASPHLPSHQPHSSIGAIDLISTESTNTTMPSMMPSSSISYSSPQQSSSSSSPNQIQNYQPRQIRPIRVAQPPQPFPSTATMPSTSFPSSSSGNSLPSFISVPTLHPHKNSTSSDTSVGHFTRSAASTSALAERFGRMSYEELIDLARNQQRQIEANEAELDERRKAVALFGVARRTAGSETEQQQNAKMLMASLRAQIERDEKELAQLGHSQKEAKQLREHNQNQKRELQQLESEYAQYEQQLRGSVQKVDSLRNQLEIMYQRRAAAADAAVAMQRQINGGIAGSMDGRKMSAERRPKASVSPFKTSESQSTVGQDEPDCPAIMAKKPHQPLPSTSSAHQPPPLPQKSTTSIQTINWRREYQPNNDFTYQNGTGGGSSLLPPAVDKISLRRNSINQAKRNSLISESGDEHVLALLLAEQRRGGKTHMSFGRSWDGQLGIRGLGGGGGGGLVANAKASLGLNDKNNGINGSLGHRKELGREPGKLLKKEENGKQSKVAMNTVTVSTEPESLDQPKVVEEPPKHQIYPKLSPVKGNSANGSPVKNSVKNVSPSKKAATLPSEMDFSEFNRTFDQQKKRDEEEDEEKKAKKEVISRESSSESEEESENLELKTIKNDENEVQHVMILEENVAKKNAEKEEDEKEAKSQKHQFEEEEDDGISSCGQMLGEIQLRLDESMAKLAAKLEEEEATTTLDGENRIISVSDEEKDEDDDGPLPNSPTISDKSLESEKEEFQFDKSWQPQPSGAKSILRRQQGGKNGNKRRVKIDLIVLFLDVAYEGHYDDLVELVESGQIENISVANSEGITALHYAICADNIQIVRFLIEHEADVNAMDFDAWSPLHCAASCNNLALMQLLIENGACPFATTISKFETASQLFDTTSDYFEPAEYMALVEECMGEVNDRKVYAAYSYKAANSDELDFEEGDELRVLRKREIEDEDDEEEEGDRKRKKNGKENDDENEEEEEEINENEQMEVDEPHYHYELWWLCEHGRTGKRGLVPRNYLALFPTRKHRGRYQINFQLPQHQHRHSIDTDENDQIGEDENHHGAILNVVQNGKPLGHQELSTYA